MSLRGSFWYEIRQCLISGTLLVIVLHSLGAVAELLPLQKSRFKVTAVAKNLQYDFGGPSKFGGPRLQPFSLTGSGVAIGGSAGSRNRGPRALGAPDRGHNLFYLQDVKNQDSEETEIRSLAFSKTLQTRIQLIKTYLRSCVT